MNSDLKIIKKKYGEDLMHLCRTLFPTILEIPGKLSELLLEHFEPSKFLYEDIIHNHLEKQFQDYIYSLMTKDDQEKIIINRTPTELLSEAGYDLYECKTEEDIQSFRKYYKKDEELCTFNGGRLDKCYVFFAVKKNVEEIKRENFTYPHREDEYGTSVISIQFSKGQNNILSIKNRYNHRVQNPDATFQNNLDNIIPGLTASFEQEYNFVNTKTDFYLPGYVKGQDGKFYKYNYEINNIYYCPNNIIIDSTNVIRTYEEQTRYLIIDYFILDIVNKKIELYDQKINDSFLDGINDIEKITITKSSQTGNKIIGIKCKENNIIIEIDKQNRIIGYENQNIQEIGDNFLKINRVLKNLNLPNLKKVGDNFLNWNCALKYIFLPSLEETGDNFLSHDNELISSEFPKLKRVGNGFLEWCSHLKTIVLSSLEIAEDGFMSHNNSLIELHLPNIISIGNNALSHNYSLKVIDMPNLISMGTYFHNKCTSRLITVNLPKIDNEIKTELLRVAKKNVYRELKKEIIETKKDKRRKRRTIQRKHGKA